MVHISLPHRISHLGHHKQHKDEGKHNTQRPSPSRHVTAIEQNSLMLRVNVIKGRNLAAKDKSGTSDPYLVVTLGQSRQSTPTISRTLNPEWRTCFDLPLAGVPLIECVCWDRDRFRKDYMGEFDVAVEDIFANGKVQQEPHWYRLHSRRATSKRKNDAIVSGDVQLQFSLFDSANPSADPEEVMRKLKKVVQAEEQEDDPLIGSLSRTSTGMTDMDVDEHDDNEADGDATATKAKKKRMARLRRKSIAVRAYEFGGDGSDVSGMVFLEIIRVSDLPPERNMTRTTFDMDPFVVTSLGKKVLRTKVVWHNLNPIFNEKIVFQIMPHETNYMISFTVLDWDRLTGNDFVASTTFPVSKLMESGPELDEDTGLYALPEPREYSHFAEKQAREKKKGFRLPISRSSSASNLTKVGRPSLKSTDSQSSMQSSTHDSNLLPPAPTSAPSNGNGLQQIPTNVSNNEDTSGEDPTMEEYTIPLELKKKDRWEDKHSPKLLIRAKYLPYKALRQQFWRAMLKQYDADESGRVSKMELTAMLDTIGSTLKESTIDGFFTRFGQENQESGEEDLTFDQAVIALEDQLDTQLQRKSHFESVKNIFAGHSPTDSHLSTVQNSESGYSTPLALETSTQAAGNEDAERSAIPAVQLPHHGAAGEEGRLLTNDLSDDSHGEEHVIQIRECPICHQPKLNKLPDSEIITHIATCASSDWKQVNNLVMGGFVTQSQAHRKWFTKVVHKVSYGGYKLGANSANILVQDRLTGQINEERMSVYVRLGIRLLYKAMGSREMEKRRIKKMLKSLSVKQGRKYDDPASAASIEGFVNFHRLDMSEVLQPIEKFKNFNEFFYRALKPGARPCSAPDRPEIIVSPADCRTVVFNTIDDATRIWVKGRDYSLEKLFGDAYPDEVRRFKGGSMGIFRLAPQDYHRFHIPVDGVLGKSKQIDGEYYTVNPMAIRSALDVYGDNIRVLTPIDTVAHGRMMYVCIGAMMVGSTVITRSTGEHVKRAEELGYFKFGGSTILLFFEPGQMVYDDDLVENSKSSLETLVRVGMSIGHSPHVPPYRPDMKKDEKNVTMEERQEAKRRIEGSLAPDLESDAAFDGLSMKHVQ